MLAFGVVRVGSRQLCSRSGHTSVQPWLLFILGCVYRAGSCRHSCWNDAVLAKTCHFASNKPSSTRPCRGAQSRRHLKTCSVCILLSISWEPQMQSTILATIVAILVVVAVCKHSCALEVGRISSNLIMSQVIISLLLQVLSQSRHLLAASESPVKQAQLCAQHHTFPLIARSSVDSCRRARWRWWILECEARSLT